MLKRTGREKECWVGRGTSNGDVLAVWREEGGKREACKFSW
jgi:hypothetical protein